MKIIIYLEGPSDKLAMEQLLLSLISRGQQKGITISFIGLSPQEGRGNSKRELIRRIPQRAVNILCNDRNSIVCVMPDLYPKNAGGPHETYKELQQLLISRFNEVLCKRGISDIRISDRFFVFCFKHDLEVLILAAEEQLTYRLGKSSLPCIWKKPVEDQNQNIPPKRIVEQLFSTNHQFYKGTIDAPLILSRTNYSEIANRCPQCFKPFVEFLENKISSSQI